MALPALDRLRLVLSVVAMFFRSPLRFFVPPAQDSAILVQGPVFVPLPPVA